jgi:hypothetical protein
VSRSDDRADEAAGQRGHTARAGEWVAKSAFRIALALFGFVLLLIVVAIRGFGARRSREPVDDRERNH